MAGPDSLHQEVTPAMVDAALAAAGGARAWPAPLREAWRRSREVRDGQELAFQLKLGTAVLVVTLLVDLLAVPRLAWTLLAIRLVTTVPLNLAGLVLLRRGARQGAKLAASLGVTAFAASAIWASAYGGSDVIARYSMATVLVLVLSLYALPFTLAERARHALLFCVATALAGLLPPSVPPAQLLQHMLLMALGGGGTLLLLRRVRNLEAREFLHSLRDQHVRAELEARNDQLRELSESDPLTGLANRRSFETTFAQLRDAVAAGSGSIALMMIDLDHFKQFNDRLGHLAGDRCLVQVAGALRRELDAVGGHVARFGGEEFVALAAEQHGVDAVALADRLCATVAALRIDAGWPTRHAITASIGLVRAHPSEAMGDLLARADRALYRAKRAGRNRVELAEAGAVIAPQRIAALG